MHDGGGLAGQIDSRLSLQAKLFKILVVIIHSQALAHIDQNRVAGVHHSLQKCLGTMAPHLVTPDLPVLHDPEAGTGEMVFQIHHSRFQPRGGRHDLKRGAWLVSIVDAGITPHLVQQLLLLLGAHISRVLRKRERVV